VRGYWFGAHFGPRKQNKKKNKEKTHHCTNQKKLLPATGNHKQCEDGTQAFTILYCGKMFVRGSAGIRNHEIPVLAGDKIHAWLFPNRKDPCIFRPI
jgi:hypothetical protein